MKKKVEDDERLYIIIMSTVLAFRNLEKNKKKFLDYCARCWDYTESINNDEEIRESIFAQQMKFANKCFERIGEFYGDDYFDK